MSAGESLVWIFIGVVVAAISFGLGPMLLAYLRQKPFKRIWLIGFSFLNYATLVAIRFFLKTSVAFYAGLHLVPAFIWAVVYYFLAKKRLRKRGLFVESEDPVSEPAPSVEAVDHSATLSKYTFITPGEKKSAPKEPSANTAPTQPQVVGAQANVHGPIVAPVPATDTAPSKAEPVPQVAVPNKHTGLKVFSVVITFLFVAVLGFAVWSQAALQNATAQVLQLEEEVDHLEYEAGVLRKSLENANATNSSLQKKTEDTLKSASKWLDAYVAIKKIGYIYDGYKNYHQLGCSRIGNYEQYWAHNIEYCEYLGYDPCPACWVIK